jgi:hypothetical protein
MRFSYSRGGRGSCDVITHAPCDRSRLQSSLRPTQPWTLVGCKVAIEHMAVHCSNKFKKRLGIGLIRYLAFSNHCGSTRYRSTSSVPCRLSVVIGVSVIWIMHDRGGVCML